MLLKNDTSESAFVMVLMPFIIVSLLAALGMVVDSTNLYAAKVKAGAAAEQGVLSAIGSHITERDQAVKDLFFAGRQNEMTYLTKRYVESARNNLIKNGIGDVGSTSRFTTKIVNNLNFVQYDTTDPSVLLMTGEVRLEVPVFFRGVYDLIGGNNGALANQVRAFATGELRGSAFVFVLDLSSSSGCPVVGPCTCKTPQRTGDCQGQIRIEVIEQAAREALRLLDRVRDRVSIVVYNNIAQVIFPFRDAGTPGFDLAGAVNAIAPLDPAAGMVPNGNTNVSDAIMTAQDQLLSIAAAPGLEGRKNVLLLSDGSPTAMRFSPAAPAGDFLSFQLTKFDSARNQIEFPGPVVITSGYKASVDLRSARSPVAPITQNPSFGYPIDVLPACHQVTRFRVKTLVPYELEPYQAADPDLFDDDANKRISALNKCLNGSWKEANNSLGFNSSLFDVSDSMQIGNEYDFRKMYYLAAVKAVEDLMTATRPTLYTLSWGDETDDGSLFSLDSVAGVKRNYLMNLATDDIAIKNLPNGDRWAGTEAQNLFAGNLGLASKPLNRPKGVTYIGASPEAIVTMFKKIIIHAKLSVIDVRPPSR